MCLFVYEWQSDLDAIRCQSTKKSINSCESWIHINSDHTKEDEESETKYEFGMKNDVKNTKCRESYFIARIFLTISEFFAFFLYIFSFIQPCRIVGIYFVHKCQIF